MIRTTAVLLLLFTACTVPSLDELGGCDFSSADADAVVGEGTPCKAVRIAITYQGFTPGCVRVLARNANGNDEPLSKELAGKGGPEGGSVIVNVIPREGWGNSVEVEAQAFERTCAGTPVVSNSQRITVTSGEAVLATLTLVATDDDQDGYVSIRTGGTDCNDDAFAINPGVTEERCDTANDVDENCNGQSDQQELRLGQSCTEGTNCEGTRQCDDNGRVTCSVPNATLAYPDLDRDGQGDKNKEAEAFCTGVPAGYVTGLHNDCDDSRATVYAGAPELCDGLDNDCDEAEDETFSDLGMTCTDSASQCGGTMQCNGAGTATACVRSQPLPTWYPDDDGDGYGRNPGTQTTCARPAGAFVNQGGDCEDGNPFNHPNGTELCDGLDNNCDSQVEAAEVCPAGGPTWVNRGGGSTSQNWHSASTWTPGGVWVTGDGNRRALLRPGDTTFAVSTQGPGCGSSTSRWYAVWADPTNGRAYFGSEGGRLAYQDTTDPNCIQPTDTGNDLGVFGMVGLRTSGPLSLYGASESTVSGDGAAFIWDGATSLTFNSASNGIAHVYDMHGVSRDALFAVGGYEPGPLGGGPRIYRFNAANGQWLTANVQAIPGLARFNGVWVVNEKLAFAVGLSGSVARWNGSAWSKVSFPTTTDNLTSVIAFGASSVYVTARNASNSRIYRYNGQSWQQLHEVPGVEFLDITGTSPADLWVVGTGGNILHWPQ